ncbi:MAG: DUF448 domain-containing protein [Proteobacteria bacterium]|nr:DUF448 domain-containing protein [Pseudomonadota bacterium]
MGCRAIEPQTALVRVAATNDRLVVGRHAPGRGVYVHPRTSCLTDRRSTVTSRRQSSRKPTTRSIRISYGIEQGQVTTKRRWPCRCKDCRTCPESR